MGDVDQQQSAPQAEVGAGVSLDILPSVTGRSAEAAGVTGTDSHSAAAALAQVAAAISPSPSSLAPPSATTTHTALNRSGSSTILSTPSLSVHNNGSSGVVSTRAQAAAPPAACHAISAPFNNHSTSVITSLTGSSVYNTNSITSVASESIYNTSVITSLIPGSELKTLKKSVANKSSGSKSKQSGKKTGNSSVGVTGSSASPTSLAQAGASGSVAELSPTAIDSDPANNPLKVLQEVRSTPLPTPLPVPTYSQTVQAARASGNVTAERATIIRETVKFFLCIKYWWTTDDYDRIAELVVREFPELGDATTSQTVPSCTKVRQDLSMCARNIRRIAKNQEKRRGSPRPTSLELLEPTPTPERPPKPSKGSGGKGRRKSSTLPSMSMPTMVTLPSAGQLLPHTAHTAHSAHSALSTNSALQDQTELASLPFMLSTTPPISSSSTVLPPVAHFLGHPSTHTHSSTGGIVFPSLLPVTQSTAAADTPITTTVTTTTTPPAVSPPVTVARGNHHHMADGAGLSVNDTGTRQDSFLDNPTVLSTAWHPDTQLPDPLPVPPYSDKVMKAKKKGVTKFERPLIIRETVLFFLSLKYWWSSVDYDRISDFVVDYFPDLKDPTLSPNMPPNRRVRTDLSQTARNIRRREVMVRRRDSRSPEERFTAVGTVSLTPHTAQQQSTDFCNELLAAASIIESRNAMQQRDVAKALEVQAKFPKEADMNSGVIMHTQSAKNAEQSKSLTAANQETSGDASVSKEHMSESAKYPYSYSGMSEAVDQGLEPSEGAVLNNQLAVIKQEAGEEESQLDQYQVLQAQAHAQASQVWLSAQMSQALSMQALTGLTGLSAHVSQAFNTAHISEQLLSSHTPTTQTSTPPAAHQSTTATVGSVAGVLSSGQTQPVMSVPQLSPASAYALSTSTSVPETGLTDSSHVDRMSAMAMWRSTNLPDPLPVPPFSLNVLRARDSGNTVSARPRIIRETTQFFLPLKMWWTAQDYERIAELVLREFPDLKSVQNIKKDLGTCARNMRRRLPMSRNKQWGGYQSPPDSILKEGDGVGEAAGLTLGELATMASLREAQDKSRADVAGLTAFTEEQRQSLLAYEQNSLAWNALCQPQFPVPEPSPVLSQSRVTKRSLSESTGSKGLEMAEKELEEMLRQAALQSVRQLGESTDTGRRHTIDVSEGAKIREIKREGAATKSGQKSSSSKSKSDDYPVIKELISHPVLTCRDQKKLSTDSTAFIGLQGSHVVGVGESAMQAHPTPVRAHSQPVSQVRSELNPAEEEVPMNLTCSTSTEVSKPSKSPKQVKSEHKGSKKGSGNLEAFSAREQVWLPHGSPWKKTGQNMFKALPNPLPVPKYSPKLVKAHEEGLAYRHRSEIIRETARFFLGYKYWWSSADYCRISELVVEQYPELKDSVSQPGQPCYRRVQRDLSMCARNLRRKNTKQQQFSTGHTALTALPKKIKSAGTKEKKSKKEGLVKVETSSADFDFGLKLPTSTAQSSLLQTLVTPPASTATSLAQAVFQAAIDHSLPSMSVAAALPSHLGQQSALDTSQWHHPSVDYTHTTSSAVLPHLAPSITSVAHTASVLVPAPSSTQSKVATTLDKMSWPAPKSKSSPKKADGPSKTSSKKKSVTVSSLPKPNTQSKNVKPVAPSVHKTEDVKESDSASKTKPPPKVDWDTGKGKSHTGSSLVGTSGSVKSSKDSRRHGHLSSRPGHSDSRAQSNTTAIVTPTLSEAHSSADSVKAESQMSEKVYINPEHGSELHRQLITLWQEGKFFDASLEVDNCRLPAHKLVLLAASRYLQTTFRHANPASHLEVNLPQDATVRAASDFLKYMYQGVLHVSPETVHSLRRIATTLQIEQMQTYCDDYIHQLNSSSSASNVPRHSTLPHTSQVPRVSVNLRDPTHSHSVPADQSSVGLAAESMEASATLSSVTSGSAHYLSGLSSASRKRSASSSVVSHTSYEGVSEKDIAHAVTSLHSQADRQPEVHTGVVLAKRYRSMDEEPSAEDSVSRTVLDSQTEQTYQNALDTQQLQLLGTEDCLPQSALVQHLVSDKGPSRSQSSSVIQCGPNIVNAPTHVLSQHPAQVVSSDLSEHEAIVHYYSEPADSTEPSVQGMEEESIMVRLLPHTNGSMDIGGEIQVGAERIIHLSGEEAQVIQQLSGEGDQIIAEHAVQDCGVEQEQVIAEHTVQGYMEDGSVIGERMIQEYCQRQEEEEEQLVEEEVIMESDELLQEVAACETVECSLLPQTYCSSPEEGQTLSSNETVVQNMASQWAAQQYAETPLDAATAQQFAAVLQERMYGRGGSPAGQDQQTPAEAGYGQEMYLQVCGDSETVYQTTGQELVVETTAASDGLVVQGGGGGGEVEEEQGSMLPQTYCSSPQPASPSPNSQ